MRTAIWFAATFAFFFVACFVIGCVTDLILDGRIDLTDRASNAYWCGLGAAIVAGQHVPS